MRKIIIVALLIVTTMLIGSCFLFGPEPPELRVTGKKSASGGVEELASGDEIDFGTSYSYDPAIEFTFTIENTGTGPLTLTGTGPAFVELKDQSHGNYSIPVAPSESTIPAGESADFVVAFLSDSEFSTSTARLLIANDDEDEGDFELSLTGYASC